MSLTGRAAKRKEEKARESERKREKARERERERNSTGLQAGSNVNCVHADSQTREREKSKSGLAGCRSSF